MRLRTVLFPLALLAALAVVTADAAEASPMPTRTKAHFGPKVFVGGGIGFRVPLGRRAYRHRVVQPAGYWKTIPYQVWVPGHVIGYDHYGHPIVSHGHYKTLYRRVWVETAPVVVRRHRVRPSVHVGVGIGGRFRIR